MTQPTQVPLHRPRFAIFKCSDGRLQLVLQSVFRDEAPGNFFKMVNPGPMVPPYLFHALIQRPVERISGSVLKGCSWIRKQVMNSRFGTERMGYRMERFIYRAHFYFGWAAISGTYGAFRYAISQKGVRNTIIVVHEACGAHEENLGPNGRDMWNRMIKQNAIQTMQKLSRLEEARLIENWHLWFVGFSKRGIQTYDHARGEWVAMTLTDIERVLGRKLDGVTTMEDLFSEVWSVPTNDQCNDPNHDHNNF
jgi:hypothetical protein